MSVVYDQFGVTVHQGDCLRVLPGLADESVDSIVTDPPAGIAFMGRDWDTFHGRDRFVEFLTQRMEEAHRVLKPGGHALVWALPRTSHWTAWALENAGLEVRDCITHLFGNGMPKSRDVSKDIDRMAGAERAIVGMTTAGASSLQRVSRVEQGYRANLTSCTPDAIPVTVPATDAARQWAGWGTGLKPASEHWWLVRKPFRGTIAATVLEHGTGAINIGACRVAPQSGDYAHPGNDNRTHTATAFGYCETEGRQTPPHEDGRWPSNVVLSHAALLDPVTGEAIGDACADGCVAGCAVAALDAQSGVTTSGSRRAGAYGLMGYMGADAAVMPAVVGDSGGASRFFPTFRWEAKAPSAERPRVNGTAHPTVKSLGLMRWLVRLVTPPGGLVVDMFAGTGTTGQAARAEGMRSLLIEADPESIPYIRARLDALPKTDAPPEGATPVVDEDPGDLFAVLGGDGL